MPKVDSQTIQLTVEIPISLAKQIDAAAGDYASREEFVREALRRFLEHLHIANS